MDKNLEKLKQQVAAFARRNDNAYALVMRDGCDINDVSAGDISP